MESLREVETNQVEGPREKAEILRHFNQTYWAKLDYHREKEYRIFVWTTVILFGAIATLAVSRTGELPVYIQHGTLGKIGFSISLMVWTTMSVAMQNRERRYGDRYVIVIINIARMLHAFDDGYFHVNGAPASLLPSEWKNWAEQVNAKFPKCLLRNYIPATCLVGLFAAILPWLH